MYGVNRRSQRRGWLVLIGLLFLALVLAGIFGAFYFLVVKENGESPSPTPTASAMAAATETAATGTSAATSPSTPPIPSPPPTQAPATATATRVPPTDTPVPTATPLPPPETITIGVRAQITTTVATPINMRNLPTLGNSTVITGLVGGTPLDVIGGPTDADDLRWWNVRASGGITGWVVEAFGGATWLVPVDWTSQVTPLPSPEPEPEPTVAATEEPEPTEEATVAPTEATSPTAEVTATQTITPTQTVTPTQEVEATATPGPGTPTPIPSPSVGGRVRINVPEYGYLNLRDAPGLASETIGQLDDGAVVEVVEGPEEADDFVWWKVEDDEGQIGWAAERRGNEVWMVPVDN